MCVLLKNIFIKKNIYKEIITFILGLYAAFEKVNIYIYKLI